MSDELVVVRMSAEDAAALHLMATRTLQAWDGEEGVHVDRMTSARRPLEAALRSVGWAPTGDGAWVKDLRPSRGRR